jgi:GT2 family glycosyltransferase/glycosyltransferase involved in cell wall biosynthesis
VSPATLGGSEGLEASAGVDVIVPVYNGHDHVAACLTSLLANTPGDDITFVIADDASPDSRIQPLLEGFSARDPRVRIERRSQNLGFVRNCNAAMAAGTRDVVILNADTLVPPGWLDRMRRLATSSDRIATVTPLSNNAEVVSVPEWLVANSYPEGVDYVQLDAIAQATGTGDWIELPTAVGFAMYIRRHALDEIGLFNEELFGKGYGEENDLSCRFRHAGYLNLVCDTVFVAHVGGVSFAEAGTGQLAENLETLGAEWPDYHATIQTFIGENPLQGVQARFGRELLRRNKQPDSLRVLYVLHNPIRGKAIGGTEFQTDDLATAAGSEGDALVLHFGYRGVKVQWAGPGFLVDFPAKEPGRDADAWMSDLLGCGVDVIHIQHAMHIPEHGLRALFDTASAYGIPIVWSVHDYYSLCPASQLLDAEERTPCTNLGPDPVTCDGCFRKALHDNSMTLPAWREFYGEHLGRTSAIVAPSRSAARLLEAEMPQLRGRMTVMPHGLAQPDEPPAPPRGASPPHRIGVLGYGGHHKGDDAIATLMAHLPGPQFEFHLFGRDDLARVPEGATVRFHGRYQRHEIVPMLRQADLSCVLLLPVWPETYSYTLSEAWAAGVPVFGANQGAISERIGGDGGGVVIEADPTALVATARQIAEALGDRDMMLRLSEEARRNGEALATIDDMWASYLDLYRSLGAGSRRPAPARAVALPTLEEMRKWFGYLRSPLPATTGATPAVGSQSVDA